MKTDRISAWFDDELDKAEVDSLIQDLSEPDQHIHYQSYDLVSKAMHASLMPEDCMDHSDAISRLLLALDEEAKPKQSLFQKIYALLFPESLFVTLRQNWVSLAAVAAAVSIVLLYPVRQEGTTIEGATFAQPSRAGYSVIRASTDQLGNPFGDDIDDYIFAHESVSAIASPVGGGLASIRSIVHSDRNILAQGR